MNILAFFNLFNSRQVFSIFVMANEIVEARILLRYIMIDSWKKFVITVLFTFSFLLFF